ncbi:LysE family translocator [Selenomonas ruminantium]|uniref:Threonine/homoserine/homoserine lactone efflux protein n=1 Tax=Selenomonas ruminantium TaxID=971 RepID=A0A1H0VPL1_SELRU|nr:LysE family translocator [Selenomonas ruminantium]SDP80457.1 Threonine/homoserine/homoserine lactone efflux protein [Selenomonas ruminantium]
MEINTVLYFLTASILLTLAPGPDNMYLLAKSLSSGARCGVALSAGLASGIVFHTTLVILGVAALIQSSALAFVGMKCIGAAYLLYLAWKAFHEDGELQIGEADDSAAYGVLYRRGVLMNVLNPKVLLFFLAFLPQFVDSSSEALSWHIAQLGAIFAFQAFVIFSLIAICAGSVRIFISRTKNLNRILGIMQGVVLTGIALAILLS